MNIADDSPFDVAKFTPTRLLGEGVWGRVYDLGDGTVLKIARETCAGIGSGGAKIENECRALRLLAEAGALAGLIPVVCRRGAIPPASPLAAEGFTVWLRMTKMPGRSISPEHIGSLSRSQQSRIAHDIGVALARVQAALRDALTVARTGIAAASSAVAYAEITNAAEQLGDPFYLNAIAALARARSRVAPAALAHAVHGDFNPSNILVGDDGSICGILDFAEWGADFPEKDFAHILQELPAIADQVVASYERASGFVADPARLTLALVENALFGAVIGARQRDADSVQSCRRALSAALENLAG
jgi:aminoglycoside phosphotransferase (APT) family kinase protein